MDNLIFIIKIYLYFLQKFVMIYLKKQKTNFNYLNLECF